jgi:hypothetical protein
MRRLLLLIPTLFLYSLGSAQNYKLHVNDSLNGFNETPLIEQAINNGVGPEELSQYIAVCRRNYIKQKYNLNTPLVEYNYEAKTSLAACVNEDFEEGSLTSAIPGTITVTSINAVNGWDCHGSSNSSGGANGNCTNTYVYGNPNTIQLIAPGTGGLTDAIIGPGYKIHSIFGNALNTTATSLYGYNCYGDWFAKINNQVAGSGVNRMKKTINVTPSNVFFNFAVLVVMEGAHTCCDGGSISITFKDCLGNLLATAQQYSIAGTPSCATASSITILTSTVNPSWKYSTWSNSSIDLSPWLGQCVTAEFVAFDCTYTGHAGYAYVDAQCAPVVINGINTPSNYIYYKAYPNPTNGNFNIEINKEIFGGEVEVRNVLGQVVLKQDVSQGKNVIKTENLAKGIYNYSVYSNKIIVSVGKVVIE